MGESPPDEVNSSDPGVVRVLLRRPERDKEEVTMEKSARTGDPRPEKVAVVDEVRGKLSAADAAILTEYRGLTVKDIADLRRGLRAVGGEYKIYKNTLVRFAVRDLGIAGLEELLVGPTAITFVEGDAVGVAKALRDFARTNPNLVVKGGVLGESILSAAGASALAEIPPREVLLARFAGLLAAPMQQFAGLLQALPRNFAYGLKALIDQRGGPAAEPEAAAPPAVAEAEITEPEAAEPTPVGAEVAEEAAAESADTADADAVAEADATPPTEEEGA
jgi:large subunit ribosomal protein L10